MATAEETRRYMLVYYVALYGIYWYDFIVCLPKEYRRAKWTYVKLCYILNRWSMLALSIVVLQGFNTNLETAKFNKYMTPWQSLFPLLVQACIGFILMLRCYAIWGHNKAILATLMVLHVAHIVVTCWVCIVYNEPLEFETGVGPCIPVYSNPALTIGCVMALVFDVVASGLCIWQSCKIKKEFTPSMRSSIVTNLIRHGSLYAVGVSLTVCANLALIYLSRNSFHTPFKGYLGGNLCTVFGSIATARLVLSLKQDVPEPMAASLTGLSFKTSGLRSPGVHQRNNNLGRFELASFPDSQKADGSTVELGYMHGRTSETVHIEGMLEEK